jgi:hypothetical protein
MDMDALVVAAKEIDRKAALQESRSKRFAELAVLARKADGDELRRIQNESRELGHTVVDFGDAINALRSALHSKSCRSAFDTLPDDFETGDY